MVGGVPANDGRLQCDRCGAWVEDKDICAVDGEHICTHCMYGDVEPFDVYPIGVVRNELQWKEPRSTSRGWMPSTAAPYWTSSWDGVPLERTEIESVRRCLNSTATIDTADTRFRLTVRFSPFSPVPPWVHGQRI